jgi:hypothetical protein
MARLAENNVDQWKQGIKLIGVGFYICACIVGGALGGMWLDSKFNINWINIRSNHCILGRLPNADSIDKRKYSKKGKEITSAQ